MSHETVSPHKIDPKSKFFKGLSLALILIIGLLSGACKTQEKKVYRVGILCGLNFIAEITDGFKEKMTELGYIEGENIEYDVQRTDFDIETYQNILKKFVEDDVDLILTFPTEATIEGKAITEGTDIPLIFTFALIDGLNVVDSIQAPGGNITGVRYPGPDIAIKRFEIMQQLAPDAKTMWIPYQEGYPIVQPQLDALYPIAEPAGVTIIEGPANNPTELEELLKDLVNEDGSSKIDAILFVAEPLTVTPEDFEVIGKFAYEHKIPFGGAIMTVGSYTSIFGVNVDTIDSGRQAAPLADKIFKGTSPGEIPLVSAENYFEINYKAALELGIEVPEGLLNQANHVITE